ncbi:charged multivesicular body protein 6 isoform X2 [Rhinatrema bivittatum]|uniref:charged multivesicular body protein 6 isoform X2 n=1 Tax=Rhinatrema bivittatum TaxID=194408 RepID=UPI001127A157|nr:charged multivesicular body protein 6 isoform X2 [Rhinatrema bivittatum]
MVICNIILITIFVYSNSLIVVIQANSMQTFVFLLAYEWPILVSCQMVKASNIQAKNDCTCAKEPTSQGRCHGTVGLLRGGRQKGPSSTFILHAPSRLRPLRDPSLLNTEQKFRIALLLPAVLLAPEIAPTAAFPQTQALGGARLGTSLPSLPETEAAPCDVTARSPPALPLRGSAHRFVPSGPLYGAEAAGFSTAPATMGNIFGRKRRSRVTEQDKAVLLCCQIVLQNIPNGTLPSFLPSPCCYPAWTASLASPIHH